ncbi:MAG: hypothetical protein U0325_20290 [Polyangiales bacterium]
MEPTPFRARRLLERLADLSIGFSLAAATAVVFSGMFGWTRDPMGIITGLPTLVFGTLWALLLRWQRTAFNQRVRVGWMASIPLAMVNGAVAAGMMLSMLDNGSKPLVNFLMGMVAGATIGVMFWGPALVATLVLFGLPIAWGQRLAKKGLAGQERGDGLVGLTSGIIAAVSLAASLHVGARSGSAWFTTTLAALGTALGTLTMVLAWARDRQRRAFVAKVEAGEVPRFRVEPSAEGKVLVRIVSQGEGYRVADFAEEIARIDASGEVTRVAAKP